jgi:hypothetical protein
VRARSPVGCDRELVAEFSCKLRRIRTLAVFALMLGCGPSAGPSSSGSAGAAAPAAYSLTVIDGARITSKQGDPGFQKATGVVVLHDAPFAAVTLVFDLSSTCFPFENWKNDRPPVGQNWPADCDAFDRNLEITLRDPNAATGAPALELVHAITPFGGPMHIEQDVTDIFNTITGSQALDIGIPTASDGAGKVSGSNGGWNVSARLDVSPGGAPRKVLGAIALFSSTVSSADGPITAAFVLPSGTTHARIEYAPTGHGQGTAMDASCIGPADEFCRRAHVLSIDGNVLSTVTPWRGDCAKGCTLAQRPSGSGVFQYCQENPCGDPASVRAPRANWCPGSVTPPLVYEPDPLKQPGAHSFVFDIRSIGQGGSWVVGAKVLAYGD